MDKLVICKRFKFDAAHRLPNYVGKCSQLHGHTWILEVEVEGIVNEKTGMILDFKDLKRAIEDGIIEELDHSYLNDKMVNPTAENILQWIWSELLTKPSDICRIRLYESEDSYVEWRK